MTSHTDHPIRQEASNETQPTNLTLRDYFAAKSLNGMLSVKNWFGDSGGWSSVEAMAEQYATEAYMFADAMLKAREPDNE